MGGVDIVKPDSQGEDEAKGGDSGSNDQVVDSTVHPQRLLWEKRGEEESGAPSLPTTTTIPGGMQRTNSLPLPLLGSQHSDFSPALMVEGQKRYPEKPQGAQRPFRLADAHQNRLLQLWARGLSAYQACAPLPLLRHLVCVFFEPGHTSIPTRPTRA